MWSVPSFGHPWSCTSLIVLCMCPPLNRTAAAARRFTCHLKMSKSQNPPQDMSNPPSSLPQSQQFSLIKLVSRTSGKIWRVTWGWIHWQLSSFHASPFHLHHLMMTLMRGWWLIRHDSFHQFHLQFQCCWRWYWGLQVTLKKKKTRGFFLILKTLLIIVIQLL